MSNVEKVTRTIIGEVVGHKMNKSIVVEVMRQVTHRLYGKIMKRYTRIAAHDEENTCNLGDVVQIKECRPISKSKRWTLDKIVERAV